KEVYVPIPSGSDYYRMGRVALNFTGYQISGNDTTCLAIYFYHVQHFVSVVHLYLATCDLSVHSGIGTQQQLLPGLSLGIKVTGNQYPTKGTILQYSPVITGER